MNTNNTPETGFNDGGASESYETLNEDMDGRAPTPKPTSSNDVLEDAVTTRSNDTAVGTEVTPQKDVKPPIMTTPSEFTEELRDWLSVNVDYYQEILLHGLIHDRNLRDAVSVLPLDQKDIDGMENAIVFLAIKKATMVEQILGVEIPVPAGPTFLEPHVNAAAFDLECGEPEILEAMSLIRNLQSHDYTSLHGIIQPCLAAWFGAKRGKRVARQFMFHKVPDVRGITETLIADLDAASGLSLDLDNRKFDYTKQPDPPEHIISLFGNPIGTPGNLVTIQGPVKSAKTTAVEAIMATALRIPCVTCDTLGFSSTHSGGRAILQFDSEQSKHDHDRLVRRVYHRAKRSEEASWLHSYHLTGLDPGACWNLLMLAVKSAVKAHGGIMMILIDGIADFCNDPNDGKECFELVRKLHKLAVDHACVIVCVIHENPGGSSGGGKTRGHLGSHLERKAETSLRLQKDTKTGVVEMWVERGRSCFIPKSAGIRFQWSDEAQMFVTLHASDADVAVGKMDKLTRFSREVDLVFAGEQRLTYGTLVDKIISLIKLAESTAKQRVSDYVSLNLIKKYDDRFYQMIRTESA